MCIHINPSDSPFLPYYDWKCREKTQAMNYCEAKEQIVCLEAHHNTSLYTTNLKIIVVEKDNTTTPTTHQCDFISSNNLSTTGV